MLDAEGYAGHHNRPLSLRERQEEILRRTMAALERTEEEAEAPSEQAKKKRDRGGCFACLNSRSV